MEKTARYLSLIAIFLIANVANLTWASASDWTIARGDTLRTISLRVYGTKERAKDLFELNKDKLVSMDAPLVIGMTLQTEPPRAVASMVTDAVIEVRADAKARAEVVATAPTPAPTPALAPTPVAPATPVPKSSSTLSLEFLPGTRSYQLKSDVFSGDAFDTPSLGGRITLGVAHATRQSFFRFEYSQVEFNSLPEELTPGSVNERRARIVYENLTNDRHGWGPALEVQSSNANETSPNVLLPSRRAVLAGLSYLGEAALFGHDSQTRFSLKTPLYFEEKSPSSGVSRLNLYAEFSHVFAAKISDTVDFQFGFEALASKTDSSGAGDRGTVHARELDLTFRLPLGLTWK